MNNPDRSAFKRFAVNISLTGAILPLAFAIGACNSASSPLGTSVTLSNGETAGIIVTMDPNESTTPAAPSESVSGTASTGDDIIAAPTVPKAGTSYAFRYQNIMILPGTDATATLGSLTEDPEIADSVENDKKGNEVTTRSYTFSNFDERLTLIFISRATSPEQMYDTIQHELKHATEHIGEFFGVEPQSEESAYLQGELARNMFAAASIAVCPVCKCA